MEKLGTGYMGTLYYLPKFPVNLTLLSQQGLLNK